jgi:hypothetical protein
MGAFDQREPGSPVFEIGQGLSSPRVHYLDLQENAGQDESLGPPIDTPAEELWMKVEADKPGVFERFFERVFGDHDSDEQPAFWEDERSEDD